MARSVATRLVVFEELLFFKAKLTVTLSAGSIAPFVQLSDTSAVLVMANCEGTTLSELVEELLPRFGSGTGLETVEEFV